MPASTPFEAATEGPFAFLWEVSLDGYVWDDGSVPVDGQLAVGAVGPYLTDRVAVGLQRRVRRYAPLADPGLHRKFGDLALTPEAIQAFANDHGLLTRGAVLADSDDESQHLQVGEPISLWQDEIATVRHLLTVWDLVQSEATDALGKLISWQDRPAAVFFDETEPVSGTHHQRVLAHEHDPQTVGLIRRWSSLDVLEPARYYVHAEINERLRGHASPVVIPFRRGEILFSPDSLLTAINVVFAMELSGRQRPALKCGECQRYFIPTHGRQKYCREACRKRRWWRTQQKEEPDARTHKKEG